MTEGWVDFSLLGAPYFWKELARQLGLMVFTPIGLGLTVLGLTRRSPRNLAEWSLLAWGAGVLLQDLVFATRFTDQLSHGTEYYNLALVPVAGLMISDGILQIRDRAGRLGPLAVAAAMVALATSSPFLAREARTPPAAYGALIEDCKRVRELSDPGDPFLVFADRAGTILYYCQRRGTTFALGNSDQTRRAPKGPQVSRSQMDQAARAAEDARAQQRKPDAGHAFLRRLAHARHVRAAIAVHLARAHGHEVCVTIARKVGERGTRAPKIRAGCIRGVRVGR